MRSFNHAHLMHVLPSRMSFACTLCGAGGVIQYSCVG